MGYSEAWVCFAMRYQRIPTTQVGVIPVCRADDGTVQVCLIRKKGSKKWGIPKGFIDPGHNHSQAALAEADEEAGLDGRLLGEAIGTYEYEKGSRTLSVAVYVMEVLEERATWREMRWRKRRWCLLEDAGERLRDHGASPLYDRIRPRLSTMLANSPSRKPGGSR